MYYSILFFSLVILVSNIDCQNLDCSQPPRHIRRSNCCPTLRFPMSREIREKCGHPQRGNRVKPECDAVQCVLQELKVLDSKNKVNQTAFRKFMESKFSSEWKPIILKATTACVKEVAANPGDCELRRFANCFKRNMFVNCPSNVWIATTDCAEIKSYIIACRTPASG